MIKIRETHCIHPADVARANLGRTETRELEGVAALLGAMADPTRVRIIDALRMGELCVGDLAEVLQMNVSAVSHQLRLLRTARLVPRGYPDRRSGGGRGLGRPPRPGAGL